LIWNSWFIDLVIPRGGFGLLEEKGNYEVPGYAKICGIVALILAIVGFIVPVAGVLFIAPLAIIFGAIGLYGGFKAMGIAALIIDAINFFISPSFWLNMKAGATSTPNRFLVYFDIVGIIVMLYLVVRKPSKRT
jgi:hypothetical protein